MAAADLGVLHLERYGPSAFSRLREIVSMLKRDDPFTPVTVVVPTRYASIALRRALASKRGVANVQFMTMPDLAGVLGESVAAADGAIKLTRHREAAAVRAAADGVDPDGPLAPVKNHLKLQATLRSTFRDLERVSESALRRIEGLDAFRSEAVQWYRRYREKIGNCYGEERLVVSAASAVAAANGNALNDSGHVVLYLLSTLSPGEMQLIEALHRKGSCTVIAGVLGDDAADAPVQQLSGRLCPKSPANSDLRQDDSPANMRIVSAPDAAEEVRSAVRNILGRASEGVPFHRIAVLYGQAEPYGQLIASQMKLAGIPAAGPVRRRLQDTPPGKLVDLLLKAVKDELSRSAVLRWVAEAPVRDPNTGAAAYDDLLLWERISADAGIVRGKDQWLDRLDAFCRGARARIASYTDSDEVSPGTISRHRSLLDSARRLRAFIETLALSTESLASGGFQESGDRWKTLLQRYAHDAGSWPDNFQEALRLLERNLDEIRDLAASFPDLDREDFNYLLGEALGASIGTLGPLGTGVFVGPFDEAQCMEFDTVHVVGVAEGALPRRASDDPILPERLLSQLGDGLALSRSAEREAQDRRSFLCALSAGCSVVLSYPRTEPGGQREQYPSPWLLECARFLHGAPVTSDKLTRLSGEPWLTVIESAQHGLDLARLSGAADEHDYDLTLLSEWSKAGLGLRSHFLAAEGPLRRALRMEEQRMSLRFTAWDGDVSAVAPDSRRLSRQRRGVLSPTGLERWAACPYRYFLGDVLGISALDAPADELSISPLDKGSLVHEVLERFMTASIETGRVPGPGESWSAESTRILLEIAESEFDRAEREGKTGRRLLWRLAREEMREDLVTFLSKDEQWRSDGWTTAAVEQRFGAPEHGQLRGAKVGLPDGAEVTFRGMIDRVDVSADGETAIVIDYKTGGNSGYRAMKSDPVDRGRRLQLPVYAEAVRAEPRFPDRVRGFFWFVTSRGQFRKVELDLEDEAVQDRFESVVAVASSGIADGTFPARPGPRVQGGWQNCRYCDFNRLCPSNRLRLWDGKKLDGALAQFGRLAEGDGEEAQ